MQLPHQEQTYRSVRSPKTRNLGLRLRELIRRHDFLQHITCNIPELLVLVLEQQDDACGLRVEGGGGVQDGLVDDVLDAGVGDGGGGGEGVV